MSQYKYWIGTLSAEISPNFDYWDESTMTYLIGQKERGESGYLHWQFCVGLKNKTTRVGLTNLNLFPTETHWEPTRSQAAHDYVRKIDTAVEGSQFSFGQLPLRRNNKRDWDKIKQDAIDGNFDNIPPQVLISHFSSIQRIHVAYMRPVPRPNVECYVYWGLTGLGKTRRAHEEANDPFLKNPNTKWWDGYQGQTDVIIDEFIGQIGYNYLLLWLDKYPCSAEIKGGNVALKATRFFITSNKPPTEWFPTLDTVSMSALRRRFTQVIHFTEMWTPN